MVTGRLLRVQSKVVKMPGGDGTGPWGIGSRTGRGLGYCNGFPVPGYMNGGYGGGFGRGRGGGFGMGWGRGFRGRSFYSPYQPNFPPPLVAPAVPPPVYPGISNEDYVKGLEAQKKYFEESLQQLTQEIEKKKQESKA